MLGWCCCRSSNKGAILMIAGGAPLWLGALGVKRANEPHTPVVVEQAHEEDDMVSTDVLGYEVETIDGEKKKLGDFRGKVVMIVNVASECGLTPQYEQLEGLYRKHKKDGLVVIGFPANNFGGQEPGSNAEIAQFCSTKYSVTFPMMAKISVKGKDAHPLYQQLAAQPEPIGGEPEWNFDKYVVDRQGDVVARFKPRTTPEDPDLVARIEALLAEDS